MVAGYFGLKMLRSLQGVEKVAHKTSELEAHEVNVVPGTVLSKVLGNGRYMVNSRHREGLLPWHRQPKTEMRLYAESVDGIPEAWGIERKRILCVQWHPEDFDTRVYHWLEDVL